MRSQPPTVIDVRGGAPLELQDLDAITLFVEDLAAVRTCYGDVFDRPVVAEDEVSTAFDLGNVLINLLQAAEAHELVTPGGVAPPSGHRVMLSVRVEDVDAVCAALAAQGVALCNGPQDRPWGAQTAAFADPAGHLWEVAGPVPG